MSSQYMNLFLIPILFGSSYADDGICDNNTFGVNCSQRCPLGYYGRQCNETCNCNFTVCDEVTGCLKVTPELDLCKPKDSGLILRHTLTVSVFFFSLLIGITMTIACRSQYLRLVLNLCRCNTPQNYTSPGRGTNRPNRLLGNKLRLQARDHGES
uniref:EGF-like domain-containing protein n=1 Tax=Magallana gigas TaxID=29159 RepID=A0A8W8KHQ1_MAGGI